MAKVNPPKIDWKKPKLGGGTVKQCPDSAKPPAPNKPTKKKTNP